MVTDGAQDKRLCLGEAEFVMHYQSCKNGPQSVKKVFSERAEWTGCLVI